MSARLGLVAYGVLHLLVAWVTVQLALGHQHRDPSSQGALQQLAAQPMGHVLVWVMAVGMLGFSLQRAVQGCVGFRNEDGGDRWKHRLGAWGKAVIYASIGVSAVNIAASGGSSGHNGQRTLSARVMDMTGGRWLVALVGVAILVFGVLHAYRGISGDFRKKLSAEGRRGDSGRAYLAFGQVGYTAKGAVIALAGFLVALAGVTHLPQKSGGLDSALLTLKEQPFGPVLLIAVAIGLACYGLFCFAWARHPSR
ncbi:MAG: DUF1206 domain-containing protein [Nocardioidaceae bacterium]|nr:DUF1206 domain-containing protein [Nocardioidaceae bacterium]